MIIIERMRSSLPALVFCTGAVTITDGGGEIISCSIGSSVRLLSKALSSFAAMMAELI